MTNCPNCGAPIHGSLCEYCGTEFDTISVTPIRPKIYPRSIMAYDDFETDTTVFYADNKPFLRISNEPMNDDVIERLIYEKLERKRGAFV